MRAVCGMFGHEAADAEVRGMVVLCTQIGYFSVQAEEAWPDRMAGSDDMSMSTPDGLRQRAIWSESFRAIALRSEDWLKYRKVPARNLKYYTPAPGKRGSTMARISSGAGIDTPC